MREENVKGLASVMRTTVINSCKELSAYSDFPPLPDMPNFMHNRHMARYFNLYADRFELRQHIRLEHEISAIVPAKEHHETGQWTVRGTNSDGPFEVTASAVMVCTGHHVYPNVPEFPGLAEFEGRVMHTHSYKDHRGFEDKKVLVIGIGNSGGDVCVELSHIAAQVYLSTRRGSWVLNRVGTNGLPLDYLLIRRSLYSLTDLIPDWITNSVMEFQLNRRFNHEMYNLKPKHRLFGQHPMVNDSLPNCILCGTVVIKTDVHHFTKRGVSFQGEEDKVYDIDAVVLATGYNIKYPFLDEEILPVKNNEVSLYKYVFPPDRSPPTLAVIGLVQPFGSIMPISELQARWAVQVFQGKCRLPSKRDMLENITKKKEEMRKRYVHSQRHTVQVDYLTYVDEVAEVIGVKPNLMTMALTDPRLFAACYFGPAVPYQYRLTGIHRWSGARDAILATKERTLKPLRTCPSRESRMTTENWTSIVVGLVILAIIGALVMLM